MKRNTVVAQLEQQTILKLYTYQKCSRNNQEDIEYIEYVCFYLQATKVKFKVIQQSILQFIIYIIHFLVIKKCMYSSGLLLLFSCFLLKLNVQHTRFNHAIIGVENHAQPTSIEFVCAASDNSIQTSSWQIKSDDQQNSYFQSCWLVSVSSCEHVYVCKEASAVLKMEVWNCVLTRKHICHLIQFESDRQQLVLYLMRKAKAIRMCWHCTIYPRYSRIFNSTPHLPTFLTMIQ